MSRFDPAAVNVLRFMPQVGGDGRYQVPRLIGQDDNQVVVKLDHQLSEINQLGVRYFFDHFTNDPTYTEGEPSQLSQSRRCSRACARRTSSGRGRAR